jgi:hypothetical protein
MAWRRMLMGVTILVEKVLLGIVLTYPCFDLTVQL